MIFRFLFFLLLIGLNSYSQNSSDKEIFSIISKLSEERIKNDIITLANFGTRHTLSDTLSETRGIGAARRWIKKTFNSISSECNNCLEVFDQRNYFKKNNLRLIKDVWINNVVAIQRGIKSVSYTHLTLPTKA